MNEIFPLFSTPIFKSEFKNSFLTLDDVNKEPFDTLSKNFFLSSNKLLFKEKRYQDFHKKVLEIVEYYFYEICKVSKSYIVEYNTSWFTKVNPGGRSTEHCHPRSIISGVSHLFTEGTKDLGDLQFINDVNRPIVFPIALEPEFSENHLFNSTIWNFPPEDDVLYVFPSYLKHTILFNNSKKSRYSFAFDMTMRKI